MVVAHVHWLFTHSNPGAQAPQNRLAPQPSGTPPHAAPAFAQVVGAHVHWLFEHAYPTWQTPQSTVPPQPSGMDPQEPEGHAFDMQTHWPLSHC
jgi:hypothetical protein